MKTWEKVMLFILLPFAFIGHGVKKSAKYMERKSKPAVAMLVAVTMMLSVLPLQALAADDVGGVFLFEGVNYRIKAIGDSPTVEIAKGTSNEKVVNGTLTIPSQVEYNSVTYTVTVLGNGAFDNRAGEHSFTSISLPDTLTTLGGTSFSRSKLTSFTVPPLVESIPEWIFSGCDHLKTVTITRTDMVVALDSVTAFNGIINNVKIIVPVGMEDDYKVSENWKNMASRITDGVRIITFDGAGAEGEMQTASVPDGGAYTLPESSFTAPVGHQLKAWSIDGKEYAPGSSITPAGDITATAVWEPCTYSVTLNTNGGTIADGKDVTSYTYGTDAALPDQNEITYAGHTFAGWYEDKDFTGDAVTAISATDEGDKTYYAKWDHIFNIQKNNATHHWYECACGEKNTEEGHTGGRYSAPDNTITDICTVCDVSLGTAQIKAAEGGKYSGSPYAGASVSRTGTLQSADFTITYIGRDGTTYNSTTPPTDAGKYSAQISIGDSGNASTASADFEIAKRSIILTSGADVKPYDGEALVADTVDVSGDGFVDGEGATYHVTGSQTNAGSSENTFTYELKSGTKANNYDISTEYGTLTVSQGESSIIEAPKPNDLTYLGSPQNLVTAGEALGGKLQYALGSNSTDAPEDGWSDTVPTGKNADTYYVWYRVYGDENYADISPVCLAATIQKAPLTLTANDHSISYGDAPSNNGVTYSGFVGAENETVLGGDLVYECSYTQYGDVGDYEITIKGLNSDNYKITFVKGTLSVKQKEITVTIADKNSVYGQDIVELTATTDGIVNDDTNVYSLSTTATKTSNVGDYAITGTALDGNYDITFVNGKYTITKAAATIAAAPNAKNGLVYNKEAQELISEGIVAGGEMQYSLNGVDYSHVIPTATNANTYTVYYKVVGDNNHNDVPATSFTVTIAEKIVDLSGVKWDYTDAFKYDGLTHGVAIIESTMPEGAHVSNYTGHSGIETGKRQAAASITYDANYKGEATLFLDWEIKNEWTPTEYSVSTPNSHGWLNQDFVIKAADGYLVSTTNTADSEWKENLTYSVETADGSATFYLKNKTDGTISLGKTVTYKLDKTPPTGRVELNERSGWETFLNTISFALFYKDEVTVKVTPNDKLSDIAKIEYASSNEAKTLDEVKAISDWTEYTDSFGVTLEDAKKFVYYVRITDNAGNVTYLSTGGAVYDITAPVIEGIENGKTYYTMQRFTVKESNLESVTVNGNPSMTFSLGGNVDKEYVVVATDQAGNTTTVTVTMKPISDLSVPIDNLTKDNVNSGNEGVVDGVKAAVAAVDTTNATDEEKSALKDIVDKAAELEKVIDDTKAEIARINEELNTYDGSTVNSEDKDDLEQLLADIEKQLETTNLTEAEEKSLEDAKTKAEGLLDTIENAAEATDTENTEKVEDVTAENVTPEDKTDLEKAKADLENALEMGGGNYTEDEKKAIEDEIKRIDDALEVIGNVEEVEELIDKLPGIIKKDDEVAIKAADDAYNALTDYEKSLVDEDAKKALDDAKATLAELNKPADSTSPDTGDNSNIWLWFALLFVSGTGIFGITLYDRKRRTASKR